MSEPTVFGPEATEQIAKTVREVARRMKNESPVRGRWQHQAGGTGAQILNFQVISSSPTTRSALVQIEQRTFTGAAYGSTLDDTVVTVYDTDGCYLNEPNVDLTGRRGKAVLMITDDAAAELHFFDDYDPPPKYWCVMSICCPTIVCEE
jgi:hypothetical protein